MHILKRLLVHNLRCTRMKELGITRCFLAVVLGRFGLCSPINVGINEGETVIRGEKSPSPENHFKSQVFKYPLLHCQFMVFGNPHKGLCVQEISAQSKEQRGIYMKRI